MPGQAFDTPLSAEAMTRQMDAVMAGRCPPDEIREFLAVLARRGETAEEIAAAVLALRAHAIRVPLRRPDELCDTCGTGGDGQGTVNVSTVAGLIAAAAGVRVAKHGNRAASSRCGSADLLEALGVNLDASPEQVGRSIEETGFGFCFAPRFHPAMKLVAPIRKGLGIRTIFNLIGPLANPLPLAFQLVGVCEERLMRPIGEALIRLGVRHGLVVHGRDGMDEVTTTAPTDALEVRAGGLSPLLLDPVDWDVARARPEALRGADARHNARIAEAILRGEPSAARDLVVVNAACAIYCAEQAGSIQEGLAKAAEALQSGRALRVLAAVRRLTS